jgi:hypothetical protein
MKKISRALSIVCLLAVSVLAGAQSATAQSQYVSPVPFYRFIVSNVNLGTLLTANYSEGVNSNFLYYPFPETAGIVLPPASGWTPTPGQGLLPLYRWRVHQDNRWYFYYSIYYSSHGSGYTYEGVSGYVLPPDNSFGGINLVADYSQTRGFYFRLPNESIPGNTGNQFGFNYQGVICNLPQGGSYSFDPPPPPPSCNPSSSLVSKCAQLGGYWDYDSCSCQY